MMHRKARSLASVFSLLLALVALQTSAEDAAAKGLSIAKERKAHDLGWGDSNADVSMILRNADGQETTRKMRIKTLEIDDDGDKGLTIFDQPRDVKGTAFLNFSHATVPDEQWMYLPALKRVKRIASRNKSGPFMGSEFAFEDLSSFEVEKYQYQFVKDDNINGQAMLVVEQIPVDKYSGYTRQLVWVDPEHYRAHRVEFYDRKNSLLKVLVLDQYEQYLDQYWRPLRMVMENKQTGKSTELLTHKFEFRTGLKAADFNKATLKRAR